MSWGLSKQEWRCAYKQLTLNKIKTEQKVRIDWENNKSYLDTKTTDEYGKTFFKSDELTSEEAALFQAKTKF